MYGIYISGSAFYLVKHKVTMPHEMNDAISVFSQLRMGIKLQDAGNF